MSFGTHITKYALFGLFLLLDGIVSATVPTTVISVYLCYLVSYRVRLSRKKTR